MTEQNPGKSRDPDVIRSYLLSLDLFSPEAIEALVLNWSRTVPQTPEEVKQGIFDEREARLITADRTWAKNLG